MKKASFFLTLLAAGSAASAQIKQVKPLDGLFNPKFDLKKDSSWRTLSKINDLVKPNPFPALANRSDITRISPNNAPLIVAVDGYKMPVLVTEDNANTPVKKIDGFSKMPVVGTNMGAPKKIAKITP